MADITLKTLADIPVVEPDDSTHLLAEQDGAYARVPKDKVGSGGGVFVVNFTESDDGTYAADKTFAEVSEAVIAGMSVNVREDLGEAVMPLNLVACVPNGVIELSSIGQSGSNVAFKRFMWLASGDIMVTTITLATAST